MQLQYDYFAAYRSLKLTRDSEGVLVAEFHSNGDPSPSPRKTIQNLWTPFTGSSKIARTK